MTRLTKCRQFWCCCFGSNKSKHPLCNGEQFITLEVEYLQQFDEIVVIGDIHGCYDEFNELLEKVHSETPSKKPEKCLKILVGDLVNKGPDSKKVLQLCKDKYYNSIVAVRGNHDERVLNCWKASKSKKEKLDERYKWCSKLPQRYMDYLDSLPYSISIPALSCIIVHAGVDPSLDEAHKTTPLDTMITMRNIVVLKNPKTEETSYMCTKSGEEGAPWANFWPGPDHIYFGHDARRRLQNDHEFATGLDTGCVYGGSLSYIYIKGPRKGEINSIKAKKVYQPPSKDD